LLRLCKSTRAFLESPSQSLFLWSDSLFPFSSSLLRCHPRCFWCLHRCCVVAVALSVLALASFANAHRCLSISALFLPCKLPAFFWLSTFGFRSCHLCCLYCHLPLSCRAEKNKPSAISLFNLLKLRHSLFLKSVGSVSTHGSDTHHYKSKRVTTNAVKVDSWTKKNF